ncbi:MAG: cellulose biosynthesis protein BcsS [Beijerinckiaceae bacterium]|nr:cellulose biosynthesis protein BcsS [Beijerinckiaceae bacterium]
MLNKSLCRAALVSAALPALGVAGAQAADWYTGSPLTSQATGPNNPLASIDLSLTAAPESRHAVLIGTVAPFGGLEQNGLRIRLMGLLGGYSYDATALGVGKVSGNQVGGSLMLGHDWIVEKTKFGVFGGLDVINNQLDKFDPDNKTEGTTIGFKAGFDFYTTPTKSTMATGTFAFSTANSAYYMRLKGGIAVYEQVYIGPETLVMGDSFYSQWRLGLHLSGVKLGPLQFGVSGGYVNDAVRGAGGYGILDSRITF